jgi:hypothetical protein
MGAQEFHTFARGKSLQQAYSTAIDNANDEYGHQQGYSGEINSTHSLRDLTEEFRRSKKSLSLFIQEKMEDCPKGMCYAICTDEPVQNNKKIRSKVEHTVSPGTKKWVLKYVVYDGHDDAIARCNTKGEAVKVAREYTEKNMAITNVYMEKVLEKGTTQVAKVIYKSSKAEKDGRWTFFGLATC